MRTRVVEFRVVERICCSCVDDASLGFGFIGLGFVCVSVSGFMF